MDKVRIGVLGVSNHFLKRVVLPLLKSREVFVYAIASRDVSKAQKVALDFNIPHAFGSYEELLACKDISAVYIPLPNHLHLDWIKKSADAGLDILCEKPISLNSKEAIEAFNYCRNKGVRLLEAFMYKFHPQWLNVRDVIRTGQLGKIQYLHTSFSYNNQDPNNIRNIKHFGGGGIMDIGCYAISVARFISEKEPIRVVSLINRNDTFGTDNVSSGILDFGEFRSTFSVSTAAEAFQKVDIVCSAGAITIDIPFNTYVDTSAKIIIKTPQGIREVLFDAQDQYGLLFDSFSRWVNGDKLIFDSKLDAINNMKVIDALKESENLDSWVNINLF